LKSLGAKAPPITKPAAKKQMGLMMNAAVVRGAKAKAEAKAKRK